MSDIYVGNSYNLKEICEKYAKDHEIVTYKIGYDDKVYILLSSNIPERIKGMFVDTKANAYYSAVVITVNWWENGEIISEEFIELGKHKMNFHFIQPIGANILLLGARSYNHSDEPEKNAVIVDKCGNVIRKMCFGDGIEDCIVTSDGKIYVSYFDEGVFGNYGWDKPIGKCGLLMCDEYGEIKWKADRDICDCYAINIDDIGNLWYYYYTEFDLIKTDLKTETVYKPKISGSAGFLISSDLRNIIFDGGYNNHFEFKIAEIGYNEIKRFENVNIFYNEKKIVVKGFSFYGPKAIFIDDKCNMYFKQI